MSIHAFWYPGGSVGWGMSAQNSGSQERQHHSEQGLTYLSTGCMCMNPCMHSVCLEAWLFVLYRWATERQVPQSQSFLPWHLPVGHHSLERASCPNNISSPKGKKIDPDIGPLDNMNLICQSRSNFQLPDVCENS